MHCDGCLHFLPKCPLTDAPGGEGELLLCTLCECLSETNKPTVKQRNLSPWLLTIVFLLFWNAIDPNAVSQRDNHHALVLFSKEPVHQIGKRLNTFDCAILPTLTQMTQRELLEPECSQSMAVKLLSLYTLLSLAACLSSSSLVLLTLHIVKTSAAYNTRSLE